jgi:uncharacterized membrane protein YqiK
MLRAYATQKSVVCGVLALLWIWFLWVYIAQPAGVSIISTTGGVSQD